MSPLKVLWLFVSVLLIAGSQFYMGGRKRIINSLNSNHLECTQLFSYMLCSVVCSTAVVYQCKIVVLN